MADFKWFLYWLQKEQKIKKNNYKIEIFKNYRKQNEVSSCYLSFLVL